jgi:hypothetical protein
VSRLLKQPDRAEFRESDLEAFDQVPKWRVGDNAGPYFGTLLNAPPFALNRAQLSSLIRTAGERDDTYTHLQRELVDQTLCALFSDNHFLSMHIGDAIAVGVSVETIEAIRSGRDEDLDDEVRDFVTYIRQVATGTVTDDMFGAVRQRIGTRGIVEYTYLITTLLMTMRQMQAFDCPQPSTEEVEEMIAKYKDGRLAAPDFRERIR